MPERKTIFVYGLEGNKSHAKAAGKIFRDKNLVCFEYDSSLRKPIEELAQELRKFIDSKISKNERVNIIGVSAGGIIADYYKKFLAPAKVEKLATICSPFRGTYITKLYSSKRRGLKELSKDSEFLRKLNSKKSFGETINFYCPLDVLVPGNSGKGENPVLTKNFFHFLIQKDKKILKKIKRFMES